MKVLVLREEEIKPLLLMDEVLKVVEEAFREKGLGYVQMPPKPYLFYRQYDGDLRVMPSYLERMNISAVKVVNVHPNNPTLHGLPTVMAIIILIDPKTGAPLAVMGGSYITAMRTGAAGGIAAKYLARKDSRVIAMVGAGTQARTQLKALITLYGRVEEVRVWSPPDKSKEIFASEIKTIYSDVIDEVVAVRDVKDAVVGADIVVTTTPSRKPLVMNEWVSEGTHFNCIGADAPGKEELDPAILKRAKIVVDDWEQASHGGEINVPLAKGIIAKEDVWGSICEIVAGLKSGRTSRDEITVFTSTGLAIQDAVTAKLVYEKALSRGVGRFIDLL